MSDLLRALAAFAVLTAGGGWALGFLVPLEAGITSAYLAGLLAFLWLAGGGRAMLDWVDGAHTEHAAADWTRFVRFTLDHKVIGVQYLAVSMVVLVVAGLMALIMRAELAAPGLQFLSHDRYNSVMTMHGIGMIVVALTAIVGGLGNYVVPLTIGARDMAFPRLNALSFWILPPAVLLLLAALANGSMDTGWRAYPPLAVRGDWGKLLFLLAFITAGFSSIFGGVNTLTTVWTMRAKGMTLRRMPIFAWSMLAAGIIMVMATSVVAASLIMTVSDRALGTAFFDAAGGGTALLYQHLFWFYSHPAVYIMILPAFGVILEILPVFSRKPLFGYGLAAGSFLGIVVLSFLVWAHHIFTSGMWDFLKIPFMILTELISIPTGVVFLCALGTMWAGKLRLRAPMLWTLGFLVHFLVGGLTGIFLADVPTDIHLHNTLFVTAHFHFTIVGGTIFAFFAGFYYWFPKISGRMLGEGLAKAHFWLFALGFNAVFLPLFYVGARGVPRHTADYPPEFAVPQLVASVGAFAAAFGVLAFFVNIWRSARSGPAAAADPWQAKTLEWTVSSPPPPENFAREPEVSETPYSYGEA
ncbi:MAG: cbb3-type cytochrome c oxidase subunit I [Elusimicrobia bacterium]|nr:cbb3-type cytochrome c oxidase subunit I [Elusimicrobiota bacterium]